MSLFPYAEMLCDLVGIEMITRQREMDPRFIMLYVHRKLSCVDFNARLKWFLTLFPSCPLLSQKKIEPCIGF